MANCTAKDILHLEQTAEAKVNAKEQVSLDKKRKRDDKKAAKRRVDRRVEEEIETESIRDPSLYLSLPSTKTVHSCYKSFYNTTSQKALSRSSSCWNYT